MRLFFRNRGFDVCFFAPIENQVFEEIGSNVLNSLSRGFDWTDYKYLKTFSTPILIIICVFYGIFNVLIGSITEELFFSGYITSHYEKQKAFTPIMIAILFSLYHFWLPFNNVFRILIFAPVSYVAYKKKNLYISICFHCLCNLTTTLDFILTVLG